MTSPLRGQVTGSSLRSATWSQGSLLLCCHIVGVLVRPLPGPLHVCTGPGLSLSPHRDWSLISSRVTSIKAPLAAGASSPSRLPPTLSDECPHQGPRPRPCPAWWNVSPTSRRETTKRRVAGEGSRPGAAQGVRGPPGCEVWGLSSLRRHHFLSAPRDMLCEQGDLEVTDPGMRKGAAGGSQAGVLPPGLGQSFSLLWKCPPPTPRHNPQGYLRVPTMVPLSPPHTHLHTLPGEHYCYTHVIEETEAQSVGTGY